MRRSLKPIGSDVAVILDQSIRDALKLEPETEVDLEVRGDSVVVRPVRDAERRNVVDEAFRSAVENPQELRRAPWSSDALGSVPGPPTKDATDLYFGRTVVGRGLWLTH